MSDGDEGFYYDEDFAVAGIERMCEDQPDFAWLAKAALDDMAGPKAICRRGILWARLGLQNVSGRIYLTKAQKSANKRTTKAATRNLFERCRYECHPIAHVLAGCHVARDGRITV
jgi:hypothetical protein